jgi:hypothetical protein
MPIQLDSKCSCTVGEPVVEYGSTLGLADRDEQGLYTALCQRIATSAPS